MATVDRCDEIIDLIDRALREALDETRPYVTERCESGCADAGSVLP